MSTPVPFYMLCGSLGAGKTTLLMRLLDWWRREGRNAGVIMNESGQVSIDGPRAGALAQQVVNLAGGCVCCDTKEDLAWGITQLITDFGSDLVILECSGMANPGEVVDAVTDAFVSRLVMLERVIALLNPALEPDIAYRDPVVASSIRYADDIVLNKRDVAPGPLWERSRRYILTQNPHARLWEAAHARVDLANLLGPHRRSKPFVPTPNVTVGPLGESPKASARAEYHPMVYTVRLHGPLNRERFEAWMSDLPAGLERAKGFFRFSGEAALQEFQYAVPGPRTVAPLHLLEEPAHAIVLIGRGYDQAACEAALLGCLDASTA